jgi:hypothetical protein
MSITEMVQFAQTNSPVIAVCSSIFAALAAIAACRNSSIAKRNQINQRLNQLLDSRYSKEMFNAKKNLRNWFEKAGRENIGQKFIDYRLTCDGIELDNYRNTFIVYFQKIYDLYHERLLKKKEITALTNATDLAILFNIGKPIQECVDKTVLKLELPNVLDNKAQTLFEFYEDLLEKGYIAGSNIKKKLRYSVIDIFSRR